MAEILPIKAWRYSDEYISGDIESLTSPLFDVVSKKQLKKLYKNDNNSIHLSVPKGKNPAKRAAKTLKKWKKSGLIQQDPIPGIYVYYQYFRLAGDEIEHCRKGFICNIKISEWDEQVILRHENTIAKSVNDRVEIVKSTELNVSPTHGFYTDTKKSLEKYMDACIAAPIYETEDYQGVRDVLGVIHDVKIINKFVRAIRDKQIILADGHHRYEGSLLHKQQMQESNPDHTGKEGYNYHLIYLTNTEGEKFRILPTHRLISGIKSLTERQLLKRLNSDFQIKEIENAFDLSSILLNRKKSFGLIFKRNAYLITLKPGKESAIKWAFPQEIKELDITVLHYFIIEKGMGIKGKDQRVSDNISFERSLLECHSQVLQSEAQVAIITGEVSINQVKDVCYSGYTMPQKTTFFYPKVICGFLFGTIKENEFDLSPYSRIQ